MKKTTRSILQELNDLSVSRNKECVIESRGANLIESAINLLSLIRDKYPLEEAVDLERRFINAIKSSDVTKFKRGVKRISEGKTNGTN